MSPSSIRSRPSSAARRLTTRTDVAALASASCFVTTLFIADVARACSSCVDPRDTTRAAMITGTIALSLLPLGFIGGVAAWIWRASKNDDDQQ